VFFVYVYFEKVFPLLSLKFVFFLSAASPLELSLDSIRSCNENGGTSDGLNSSFGGLAEPFSLDDDGLSGESAFSENLEISSLGDIDNGSLVLYVGILLSSFLADQAPKFIDIDDWAVELIVLQMEVSH